jgi:hypothetical protein
LQVAISFKWKSEKGIFSLSSHSLELYEINFYSCVLVNDVKIKNVEDF